MFKLKNRQFSKIRFNNADCLMLKSFLKSFASHSWRIGSISWPKRPALTLWGQTSFLLLLSFSRQIQKAITMLLYPNNINLLSYNFNVISTMHFYLINQKVFWGGGGMSYFFRPLYQFCNAQKHGDILYCSSWQPIYNSLFWVNIGRITWVILESYEVLYTCPSCTVPTG